MQMHRAISATATIGVLVVTCGSTVAAAGSATARERMTFAVTTLHDPDGTSQRLDARVVSNGKSSLLATIESGYPNSTPSPGDVVPAFRAWTSTTSGARWSSKPAAVQPPTCDPASIDGWGQPTIAGKTAYWLQNCQGVNTLYVSHTSGRSWRPAGEPVVGAAADEGYASVNPRSPKEVWTVTHLPAAAPHVIVVTHSTDGGASFTSSLVNADETPAQASNDSLNFFTPIQVDPTNPRHLFLFWIAATLASRTCTVSEQTEAVGRWHYMTTAFVAISHDAGATWTQRQIASVPDTPSCTGLESADPHPGRYDIANLFPEAAVDAAGNPYLVYSQINPGKVGDQPSHIVLLASHDKGAHFRRVQVDRAPWRSNFGPSIVAGGPGEIDVAWHASPSRDELDPHATWSIVLAQSRHATSRTPHFTTTVVASGVHRGALGPVAAPDPHIVEHQTVGLAADGRGRAAVMWMADSHGATSTQAQEIVKVAVQQSGPRSR
jgi:hypothetical protein